MHISSSPSRAPLLNPAEAPEGYLAVLKSTVSTKRLGNICRACDWRPTCQQADTDFSMARHRCMSYPVVLAKDGSTVHREDGCSVVFKRAGLPSASANA
jgi:hypothetical protein